MHETHIVRIKVIIRQTQTDAAHTAHGSSLIIVWTKNKRENYIPQHLFRMGASRTINAHVDLRRYNHFLYMREFDNKSALGAFAKRQITYSGLGWAQLRICAMCMFDAKQKAKWMDRKLIVFCWFIELDDVIPTHNNHRPPAVDCATFLSHFRVGVYEYDEIQSEELKLFEDKYRVGKQQKIKENKNDWLNKGCALCFVMCNVSEEWKK